MEQLANSRQKINWSRKFWHISGGLFAVSAAYFLPWPIPFLIAVATLLTWITIESMRRREPWFGKMFFTLSAPFVRHRERRTIVGNTWFALAATIVAGVFHDPVLLAGSFVGWALADPAAEIFGKLIPSVKFFDGEKSLAGSLACFVVGLGAYLLYFRLVGLQGDVTAAAFSAAAATTFGETFSFSFTINDNFTIPLVTALALSYILL